MSFGATTVLAAAYHRISFMKALRFLCVVGSAFAALGPAMAASPPPGAASCSGCHAVHQAASPAIPAIYGRNPDEVIAAMAAFRDGSRPATVMNRIARGFSEDEVRSIAAWLATQK
jgi:sulfide dehydrogenase cytochrome subunit